MVEFETLEPLVQKWKDYRMTGWVNLSFDEKMIIQNVYRQIFNKTFCLHCPGDTVNAFEKVFIQKEKHPTAEPLTKRDKRKRI